MTIRTYALGCCDGWRCENCNREVDIDVDTGLCRACLGIEPPSPPPGPPEEIFGGLRPEARKWLGVSEKWLMGETEDFDG